MVLAVGVDAGAQSTAGTLLVVDAPVAAGVVQVEVVAADAVDVCAAASFFKSVKTQREQLHLLGAIGQVRPMSARTTTV